MATHVFKEKRFMNADHMGDYVQIGEEKMHYLEQGSGEPLILIHTIGQSLYTWNAVMDALSEHYRVFALDLFGHGYSSCPPMEYSIDDHAESIARFTEAVGIESAHICAFSMGSFYALKFALAYPERVGRMILLTPGGITPTMPLFVRMLDNPITGWAAAMMINERTIENLLSECFFDQTCINPLKISEYYLPLANNEVKRSVVASLRAFGEENVLSALRTIEQEVLVIWGTEDRWHEMGIAELFHVAFKQVEFALIRNCGHIPHEEKPDRVTEHMIDFIQNGLEQKTP